MVQRYSFTIILLVSFLYASAQLKSPAQFLGYEIGTKYTPHWKVVSYFEHVARSVPEKVVLREYGVTNEGRPLVTAFISTEEHIRNLESIRLNNLRLAGVERGNGNLQQAPAIVWLSYNVHGNETSSSEASMITLYSLVDGSGREENWLRNTVVVIDPCLNPDGRDRYVNWFNSVVGQHPDPALEAREHHEPWPGGRTNHYYFDLNRDWAWQTQVETRQRLEVYNNWLPQIHVDFHEQYINNPYYFAPAAEPYHEVITPWQREFQITIGRNNARYFDEQGWLYFTREYFDLLYPSYGDTYPIYSGAIGMTYEQAGHSLAGSAVITETGDTLTLYDRAIHHHTTALSTIEAASGNSGRLVSEFKKYFDDAMNNGSGQYKTYLLKPQAGDDARVQSLLALLDRNGIKYGKPRGGSLRGFHYQSGNEKTLPLTSEDIVISAYQPKSALLKVLFEPATHLSDSATYDITAWSLPYAYGLEAMASTQKTEMLPLDIAAANTMPSEDPYAYVIEWNGTGAVKTVAELLGQGIKLRFHEKPFESGGKQYGRGSVIVLKTGNQAIPNLWEKVRSAALKHKAAIGTVATGFVDKGSDFGSDRIAFMQKPRVALLTGDGISGNAVGEIWHFMDKELNYPVSLINAGDFMNINMHEYNVLILANGSYSFLRSKEDAELLHQWIRKGGKVIAFENAGSQLAALEWTLKTKKSEDDDSADIYESLRRYENRERDYLPETTPGAIFRVELDNTHPLAFGYPDHYYTLKQDGRLFEFIEDGGWNVGVIKKENQVAGFVGSKLQEKMKDGLIFGVQNIGGGTIVYLADNVLFRGFWENGKLMFCNAVFMVGQ